MRILKADNPGKTHRTFKEVIAKIGKRNLIIAGSVLVVALAVLLNILVFTEGFGAGADTPVLSPDGGENEDFFAVSAVNRTRARDEAIEVLQTVADLGKDNDVSAQALADITRISADIKKEADMETLIRAKGFSDCIAVISGDSVNIVVECETLLPNEIAQIKEIAFVSASILPENVVITPKA